MENENSYERTIDKKMYMATVFEIFSKDGRVMRFLFPIEDTENILETLIKRIIIEAFKNTFECFAFDYNAEESIETKGWKFFDNIEEFKRMGIDFDKPVFL